MRRDVLFTPTLPVAIFDAGDFLSGTGGRIAARDGNVDKTLRELFVAATRATWQP
jgi:hypothetical protein